MADKIDYINDKHGRKRFPITHEKAVRDSRWVRLEEKLKDLEAAIGGGSGGGIIPGAIEELIAGKQDVITDLSTIRSGAASGATAYQKPSSGIPKSDLSSSVKASLDKADLVDQKQNIISDLSTIRSNASSGASAYHKPSSGIPRSDLASGAIPFISVDISADANSDEKTASPRAVKTYVDNHSGSGTDPEAVKFTSQSLTSGQKEQARTNIGAGTYSKPSSGIPASDLASGVIPSVPTISTDISTDAANDAKTASPKAVKTYVDGVASAISDDIEAINDDIEDIGIAIETIGNGAFVVAWDGESSPVAANIPAGVSVTYGGSSVTGSLAASASTLGKIYLVAGGTADNYDRYVTVGGSTYSWVHVGNTAVALSDYATNTKVTQLEHKVIVNDAIYLSLESTTNIRPTSNGITTQYSGFTRIATVRAGQSLTINFTIESGKYLRFGYTASYPTNGMSVSGYGEKNSTQHQATTTAPIDGYLVMECGSDFIAISVTMDNTDTIGRKVYELEGGLNSVLTSVYETKAIGNSTVGLLNASNGTIDASLTTRRTSDFIPFENDIELFNAFQATSSSYATACIYDSQKEFVSSIVLSSGTVDLTVKKADYPTGAYIRYSLSSPSVECKVLMVLPLKETVDDLDKMKPNVDFLMESSFVVMDVGKETVGLPLYADGTIDSSLSTRRTSDYVPFDADIILYNAFQPTNSIYAQVALYDADKIFVSAINGTAGTSSDVSLKKADYPGVAYVRFGLISPGVDCRVKRVVSSSEIAGLETSSVNYGKKIAVFGGSFASSQSGYFTESALDVWREKLGLGIDNYAVGGAGFTPSASTTITSQVDAACAEDKDPYDIYLLWGSGNDFSAQVAVGVQSDYTQADNYDVQKLNTQSGGINYCVKKILEKAPTAKICFLTSLRYLNQERGWNPFFSGSGIPMVDYVDGQISCCLRWGIPYLDQFREIAWNPYNADEMTGSDGVHPSSKGYEYIAQRQVSFLAKL